MNIYESIKNSWQEIKDLKESENGKYQVWQKYYDDDGLPAKPEFVTELSNHEDAVKYCNGLMRDPNCEAWITESNRLNESFNPETVPKRISYYKEDTKHHLPSFFKWSVADSEAKAKEASIKNPNDVYYVQYDDIMNSSSDYRYVNGVQYNINDGGFHWVNGLPKFHTNADWIAVRNGGKTWEEIDEMHESSDVSRDLAIEPGSDEEAQLNSLYEEKKINWTDLEGSDQTAVEHYLSNYGKDFTGKSWNDVESEIRSACHDIGYANEELIDNGNWMDGDMDPEPNERLVGDYIYYNYFLPSLKKNETEEPTGTSRFIEVSKKSVKDSDGFMTDYTLYHDTETDKYVTVFGDQDIYKPEDGEYDIEFDSEDDAKEWFHSYTGFDEAEDFKETPKSVASLKDLLEQLADDDFYHSMKDNWTREDFEIDSKINGKILDVIAQLRDQGVETKYRRGYPIEYSDEIQREAEEHDLSKDLFGDAAANRMSQKEKKLKRDLQYVRDIMAGKKVIDDKYHEEISLNTAKHWLRDDFIYVNELSSYDSDEVNKRLADAYPDIFNESVKPNADDTEHHETLWPYVSKHGIGPGTVPPDIKISHVYDVPNTMKTIFCSDRELTKDELSKYELSLFDSKSDPELLKALFSVK